MQLNQSVFEACELNVYWYKRVSILDLRFKKKYLGGDKRFDSPLISKVYSIVLDFIDLSGFYQWFFFFSYLEISLSGLWWPLAQIEFEKIK
jgi:hypothetical protein